MNIKSTIKLNNGIEIPRLGIGTFRMISGDEAKNAIMYALKLGYIHIDTASMYNTEEDVARAISLSGIPREKLFVTTKLWNDDQGYNSALKAFDKSLTALNMDYVDLYLIHWPLEVLRKDSWKALLDIYKSGRAKAIGVSNYTIRHLQELIDVSGVIPQVNQVEFNPYLYQKELLDYCNEQNIHITAYCPLVRTKKLRDAKLLAIAGKYKKTAAQILIRWALQTNISVIPKSSNKERIYENSDVYDFEISEEDMLKLNGFNENYRVTWDPTNVE